MKIIKSLNRFLSLWYVNFIVGICCCLVSFVVVLYEFHFMNFFCGIALGIGFSLMNEGIDSFFVSRSKQKT